MGNLFILSAPIRSGKTTGLKTYLSSKKSVLGFLTPDLNEKRKILWLNTNNEIQDFEVNQSFNNALNIGRFYFDPNAFEKGNDLMRNYLFDTSFFIVDEIGKLELMDRGFHPGFKTLIDNFYLQNHSTNLIIVVRDSILDEVIQKYNIRDFYLLNSESIKLMNKLKSIILCGGDSSRMKSDKALLLYHGIPQYRYCQSLLNVFSVETYLSINNNQLDFIGNKIVDIDHFHGPLRGLVSCIEQIIDCPILLMGVDYPLAGVNEIMQLILNYDQDVDSICFYNEGQNIFEPIFSIYNPSFISKLKSVTEENTSIQSLLKGSNVKKIYLPMSHKLISFDNINQYHEFNNAKGN